MLDRNNGINHLHGMSREALLVVERRLIAHKPNMGIQAASLPGLYLERDRYSVSATLERALGAERVIFSTRRQLGPNHHLEDVIENGKPQGTGADRVFLVFIYSTTNSMPEAVEIEAGNLAPTPKLDRLIIFHNHYVIGANGRIVKGLKAAWSPPEPMLGREGLAVTADNLELVQKAVKQLYQALV